MIKTLILDFDGTIADTRSVILKTMHQTIAEYGMPQPDDYTCAATIGLPLDEAFVRMLGINRDEGLRCAGIYRRLFEVNNSEGAVTMFPNVADTIRRMHAQGLTITIASSRGHHSLSDFVSRFGLSSCFSAIVGADDVDNAKPDPEPVNRILRQLGRNADTAMVVGDTAFDITMGRRAGAHTCGVTYGNGTLRELEQSGAECVIDDFSALPDVISRTADKQASDAQ